MKIGVEAMCAGQQSTAAASVRATNDELPAAEVCQAYEDLLTEMEQASTSSEPLATMLSTFCKVTISYWTGLFHCYDQADLPRANNELEQNNFHMYTLSEPVGREPSRQPLPDRLPYASSRQR